MSITDTRSNIVQHNEYYPFGLQTAKSWTRAGAKQNNYLYNQGSELNSTSGFYDLPYRNYDASVGRFFQVDPMASVDHNLTPYNYNGNNPILTNDPSGALYGMNGINLNSMASFGTGDYYLEWDGDEGSSGGGGYARPEEQSESSIFIGGMSASSDTYALYARVSVTTDYYNTDGTEYLYSDVTHRVDEVQIALNISVEINYVNNLPNPPSVYGDLAQTGINVNSYSYVRDPITGRYTSLNVAITKNLNAALQAPSGLLTRNPGLDIETNAHEDVHVQQLTNALNTSNIMNLMNNSTLTGNDFDDFVGLQLININNRVYANPNTELEAQTQYVNFLPPGYPVRYNNGSTQISWR